MLVFYPRPRPATGRFREERGDPARRTAGPDARRLWPVARGDAQRGHGRRYFIGHQLSALDIYWACFLALFEPLPHELCPMTDWPYSNPDPEVEAVLSPVLREHRDYIYETYLELPIVF